MYGSKFYDIKKEESLEILLISIVISICGVVAIIINDALNFDYPFWAATAAIVIFTTGSSLTIYKSWRRIVATIIGSIIGLYLSILFVEFFICRHTYYFSNRSYILIFFENLSSRGLFSTVHWFTYIFYRGWLYRRAYQCFLFDRV